MTEETNMQQSKELNVNWLRVNVPSIAAIVAATVGLTMYINGLENRLNIIEEARATTNTATNNVLGQIRQDLQPLSNLPYRVQVIEQGLITTNQRMDTYLQTLGTKVDGVADRVNGLTTKVEVLSQKIDALVPDERSQLRLPRD